MRTQSAALLIGSLVLAVQAAPQSPTHLLGRQAVSLATLPQNDPNQIKRAKDVATRNAGFIYGPSLIGEASPFPNGTLGNALHQADMDLWAVDRKEIDSRSAKDVAAVRAAIAAVSFFFRDNSCIYTC